MSSDEEIEDDLNSSLFRECLFNVILDKSDPNRKQKKSRNKASTGSKTSSIAKETDSSSLATDPADLVDFSDFLATEIFPSLPKDLKTITYHKIQDNVNLSDKWSLPLSLSTYEEITELTPPSVNDSLVAYGLIEPPKSDLQSFLSPVIAAFVSAATTPPPKWIETKVTACEICERDWIPMTYHHLIPKAVHTKVLKRGWHEERQLNSVAWLCRACHSFVHRMASNEELAKNYYTVELICEREEVQKWAMWVGKVRWRKT